ncbi:hypothetical protein M409DRAFT_55965 [Zasmidium cellare ATCC 36951]|uniref:Uncharacterized protein n=1 Tax=Zasmidium cellare ATCC 36951 TaxID=1080233 RepID=A0A6A6CD98_ZASCE|nr:uncharacterized protein M409DRAFT_55965 [Zasmidium cellare ATCC 36951]KAF2165065.1 hypothetical protein M409DRAFT_55965 [Zasmidium cellare ATCC 36951]
MAGRIARGISGIVGLGQEAYQHNKEKKAAAAETTTAAGSSSAQPQPPNQPLAPPPPSYTNIVDKEKGETDISVSSSDEEDDDEDLWLEDDAQTAILPQTEEQPRPKIHNAEKWTTAFLQRHPPPPSQPVPLPAAVVIPQRRPGSRTRGFVRAYAPALADSGIDEKAWLEFMDGFHEQTEQQGYFNVTNIAVALSVMSYTISCGPSIIVHLSALAVHTSIEAGRRLYITKKTNSYLDHLNAHYFQPRGLYALIMQYDPSSSQPSWTLDAASLSSTAVAKHTSDDHNNKPSTLSTFKASSAKTLESQIPPVCPLTFPTLASASAEDQRNAFRKAIAFSRDYYDRRERATFAAHNQDSKLNIEEKPFAGRYADPTTFEKSGLIGVLTGGAVDPRRRRRERRAEMGRGGHIRGRRSGGSGSGGQRTGIVGGVRKVLGERVLYLMVVNMPSREEMEVAAQMEARMKAEEPNWFEKWQASRRR